MIFSGLRAYAQRTVTHGDTLMSDNNLIHGHQRYTPLYSGRDVDIFNLSQRDISIEDIAHALSQLPCAEAPVQPPHNGQAGGAE